MSLYPWKCAILPEMIILLLFQVLRFYLIMLQFVLILFLWVRYISILELEVSFHFIFKLNIMSLFVICSSNALVVIGIVFRIKVVVFINRALNVDRI